MISLDPLIAAAPGVRRTRRGDHYHYRVGDREVLVVNAQHGFIFRGPPSDAMLEAALIGGQSRFGSPLVFDGTPEFVARCVAVAQRRGMAYMTQAPTATPSPDQPAPTPAAPTEAPPEPDRQRAPSDAPTLSGLGAFLEHLRQEHDAMPTPVAFGTDCALPIKGKLVHIGPVDPQDAQSPQIAVVLGPKGHLCVVDATKVAGYRRTEGAIMFPAGVGSDVELRAKGGIGRWWTGLRRRNAGRRRTQAGGRPGPLGERLGSGASAARLRRRLDGWRRRARPCRCRSSSRAASTV